MKTDKIKEIQKFIKSMRENAEMTLKHNSRSSTVGKKAQEQLDDLDTLRNNTT